MTAESLDSAARDVPFASELDTNPCPLGITCVHGLGVVHVDQELAPVAEQAELGSHPQPAPVELCDEIRIIDVNDLAGSGVETPVRDPRTRRRLPGLEGRPNLARLALDELESGRGKPDSDLGIGQRHATYDMRP